jgi:hypothetical protein
MTLRSPTQIGNDPTTSLVLLRRPEDARAYADDVLERIQEEHLAYHASLREAAAGERQLAAHWLGE